MLVAALWHCTRGRGQEGAMAPAPLSTEPQSFTLLPTIKLGPSGADSRVGGLVHSLGPCGSLQWPLLWGWEFLLLLPNPHGCFHSEVWGFISLRLSPGLHGLLRSPPFVRFIYVRVWGRRVLSAALPAPFSATLSPVLWVYLRNCRAAGSASGQTACPVCPTLCQSLSPHSNASPLRPGCPSLPLLLVWMNVYFLPPWCRTSLPFYFLSVLVVQGGAVCLPTPPSWFS